MIVGNQPSRVGLNPGTVAELPCVLVPTFCRAADHDMPPVLTAAEMLTSRTPRAGRVRTHRDPASAELSHRSRLQFRSQRHTLGASQIEARPGIKLTRRFAQLTPENVRSIRTWTGPACASRRWSMAGNIRTRCLKPSSWWVSFMLCLDHARRQSGRQPRIHA
jgi:hypothetical protein